MIWRLMCFCKMLSGRGNWSAGPRRKLSPVIDPLLQSQTDFLVKDLQDLFRCTTLQQFAMYLQAGDRVDASFCRTEFRVLIRRWAVFARLCACLDDMLDLPRTDDQHELELTEKVTWTDLIHEHLYTRIHTSSDRVV